MAGAVAGDPAGAVVVVVAKVAGAVVTTLAAVAVPSKDCAAPSAGPGAARHNPADSDTAASSASKDFRFTEAYSSRLIRSATKAIL